MCVHLVVDVVDMQIGGQSIRTHYILHVGIRIVVAIVIVVAVRIVIHCVGIIATVRVYRR